MQLPRKPSLVLVAAISAGLLGPAAAQGGFSSQLVPVSEPVLGGNNTLSDVAIAPNGEALIAWNEGDVAEVDVKVRRVSPDGSLGPTLAISDGTTRGLSPQVSFAPNGRAIVAWIENVTFSGPNSIRARWIEPDDTLGSLITLRTGSAASNSAELTVSATSTNAAVAAWHNFSSTPGPFRTVEGRRIAADGTVGNLIFPSSNAGAQNVRVEPNTGGGTLFAWDETTGIKAQSVDAADAPLFLQTPVADTTAFHALATDGADHFQLAYRKGNGPTSLEYKALAADGTSGAEQNLDPSGPTLVGPPDVATNPSNRSLVGWPRPLDTDLYAINARFISSDGVPEASTLTTSVTTSSPSSVDIGIGGSGGGVIAWTEETTTEPTSLWGRILPAGGSPSAPLRLSSTTGRVGRPLVEMAANDVGVSAWAERLDPTSSTSPTQMFIRQILPPPVCPDVAGTVVQGRPTPIDLSCTGFQLDAPQIVGQPLHGTLGPPGAADQSVLYTPDPRFDGTDSFTFAGANRGGTGVTHTATVTVGKDTVKPKIKKFKITKKRVGLSRAAPGGKKPAFKLRYSEAATGKIVVERINRCSTKSCKKFKRIGKLKAKPAAITAKVVLPKRLGGKSLRPAAYRATAIAEDLAGNRSKRKRLKFTVLAP